MDSKDRRFKSFQEFYPFYLQQHENRTSRRFHFIGLLLAVIWLATVLFSSLNGYYALFSLLLGYGSGFIGHFVFEKNKPATFSYPLYSFVSDFVMAKDILTGKIDF
jgi:hypothetical protein